MSKETIACVFHVVDMLARAAEDAASLLVCILHPLIAIMMSKAHRTRESGTNVKKQSWADGCRESSRGRLQTDLDACAGWFHITTPDRVKLRETARHL